MNLAPSSSSDPEVRSEQAHLDRARDHLAAMHSRAQSLVDELVAAGNPDLDYLAALVRRVRLLEETSRPLLFGRIDEDCGTIWHIGRRHVEDSVADPIVIDWRAPVSVPFYRARPGDALGLKRRRQIMVDRNVVLAVADDLFAPGQHDDSGTRLRGGDALLAELERTRTGEMLDIVATIQAEQDEIIRASLARTMTVQGGPGTGKTAVGLHRAAFLLYNHPVLARDGILVLGPSRAFLRYIAQVLPSLGEEAVAQMTASDLAPKVKIRDQDPFEVRRLKGDVRMAELLHRALHGRRQSLAHDVSLGVRFSRGTLSAEDANSLAERVASQPAPYKSGRTALRARLVSEIRRTFRNAGKLGADEPWFEKELVGGDEFRSLIDCLWPSVSPAALVGDLLGSRAQLERYGQGLLTEEEWPLLFKEPTKRATPGHVSWTIDDLPLLDEASFLLAGRTRSFGHVVVDEAQDLTPMQLRMIARRAPTGSMTILGDLAQASGPWGYGSWDEITAHLPERAGFVRHDLTLGYRAPGRVLDFAARLLPLAAPGVPHTTSIRAGRRAPKLRASRPDTLLADAIDEAVGLVGGSDDGHSLVALVAAGDHAEQLWHMAEGRADIGRLDLHAMTRPITIVPAPDAKGLEFDAVVVVEPAAIVAATPASQDETDHPGLRALYVAMTRPIHDLSIVHAMPLPSPLTPAG